MHNFVWSLAVHVYQQLFSVRQNLVNGNKIIASLAGGIQAVFKNYITAWQKKFLAAASIFYMDSFFPAVNFHMGNEPVGPGDEFSMDCLFVLHGDSITGSGLREYIYDGKTILF